MAFTDHSPGRPNSTSSRGNQLASNSAVPEETRRVQIGTGNKNVPRAKNGYKPGREHNPPPSHHGDLLNSRAYQIEMFQESLQKNIIVAMPTGSGKTQVAILRVRAEVETTPPDKISWFLAPTVALCQQQHAVFVQHIPAVQIKLLTGSIIEKWSNTRIWDDFLDGTRIVVSTYQLLYDAISHAFVRFDRLTLVVVDEAHNCRGNSPVAKMMDRYRERKEQGLVVPAILGLTASPIMNSRLDGIEEIERKMDAVCKTPAIHREELTSVVKLPEMRCALYSALPDPLPPSTYTISMQSLQEITQHLEKDIFNDPEVTQLKATNSERSREQLKTMLIKRDTYAISELKAFVRKSHEIRRQIGPWAVDHFISRGIAQHQGPLDDPFLYQPNRIKKDYLARWLGQVKTNFTTENDLELSEKIRELVRVLLASPSDAMGIVFVNQTATVAMLAEVLPMIPEIRTRFRVGMMVGTSQSSKRAQTLGELHRKLGDADLEKFRHGNLNLLVATTVLEEGIDVPACNLVVCFDPPANLKSFIQRRGRARKGVAQLVLLVNNDAEEDKHEKWLDLENEMKKRYQDEVRQATELEAEEVAEIAPFHIHETGAQLDFDHATSHLQHVCTHLSLRPDADSTPYYLIHRTGSATSHQSQITATVVLPTSLPTELRRFKSENSWYAEKNAKKDAAFVAFKALYEARLVDNHLMPLQSEDGLMREEVVPGLIEAKECYNPWFGIAQSWKTEPTPALTSRALRLHSEGGTLVDEAVLSFPSEFPHVPSFPLYWDSYTTWTASLDDASPETVSDGTKSDQSSAVLDIAFGHRYNIQDLQHIVHVRLPSRREFGLTLNNDPAWVTAQSLQNGQCRRFLIRDEYKSPFFYESWVAKIPEAASKRSSVRRYLLAHADQPWLALQKWPRRIDFLDPAPASLLSNSATTGRLTYRPLVTCRQDTIPVNTVQLGTILPSVLYMVEIYLIAQKLFSELLEETGLKDLSLIVTAISSSKARRTTNYQRFEFLGDTILKFLTTITLSATRPHYPEGYLTIAKSNIVSNAHLCRVTLRSGLDEYILTEPFAGRKWRPNYVEDLIRESEASTTRTRMISAKTLADVVESLAGAAFIEGGWECAARYLRKMIPEVGFCTPDEACIILQGHRPVSHDISSLLAPLEELCGYTFKNKTLLAEAMTHSSFSAFCELPTSSSSTATSSNTVNSTGCASLERLEFLGDAVLDMVVVQYLWDSTDRENEQLSHQQMHLLRTAAVNADLLGFLAMEWSITQQISEISPTDPAEIVKKSAKLPLWKFMRHSNPAMGLKQQIAEHRHREGRGFILSSLFGKQTSSSTSEETLEAEVYPWTALAHLHIPKTFSDLVEALLGAIWTDSGSLEQCTAVAERIGILPVLRRLVADGVDVLHPKNKLGEFIRDQKVRYEVSVHDGGIQTVDNVDHGDSGIASEDLSNKAEEDVVMSGTDASSTDEEGEHYDTAPTTPNPTRLEPLPSEVVVPAAVQAYLNRADRFTCKVFVDEKLVANVGGGLSREEIITKAADEAYKILLARWGPTGPPPSGAASVQTP